jgi:hypothetical protein
MPVDPADSVGMPSETRGARFALLGTARPHTCIRRIRDDMFVNWSQEFEATYAG